MPLSAPPDYTRSALAAVIGVGVALCLFCLTRSTLPHVGDNIHSLPHGGYYKDGTKIVSYGQPRRDFPSSNLFGRGNLWAVLAILGLSLAIWCSSVFKGPCRSCGKSH